MSIPENGSRGDSSEVLSIEQYSRVGRSVVDEVWVEFCSENSMCCNVGTESGKRRQEFSAWRGSARQEEGEMDSSLRVCVRSEEDLALDSRVRRRGGGI